MSSFFPKSWIEKSILLRLVLKYKVYILVLVIIAFIGYLQIPNVHKMITYYERKYEYQNSMVSPIEFRRMNAAGQFNYIIDVRTPEEFREGHIPNAINIPLKSIEVDHHKALFQGHGITHDDSLFIYCRSGNRALQAFEHLVNAGYDEDKLYFSTYTYKQLM